MAPAAMREVRAHLTVYMIKKTILRDLATRKKGEENERQKHRSPGSWRHQGSLRF